LAGGNVEKEEFSVILQRAYAAYGLSVVTDRALPDARDGLKPVQRRILYGMFARRYLSTRPTVKSAEIVGGILGDYHPHGDSSVYDAMVRLAQDFTMRYPLIEGQGNFGSLDSDPAAAYRYTEARLSPMAEALMADIEKETVSLRPTYKQDPRVIEPDYMPGRLPPVVNPSSGIAVGLSTNILPHNLGEVMRAAIALLDKPKMTVEQLMNYIKGPDFPTGGRVMGLDGIKEYLATGKGRLVVRGEVRLEENPRTRRQSLVIVGLPPTLAKDKLKASLVKAINDRKLEGLVPDVRDESDAEKGIRIVLELKKDAPPPGQVLAQLWSETDLQMAVTAQMVFLFGEPMQAARQPKQVGMVELLNYWNTHQLDVLRRRSQYELAKAQDRRHIVEGLIIGSAYAEEIVKIFHQAADPPQARAIIRAKYKLSERQVEVIAGMTLSQLTRLDAGKYDKEKQELIARIAELEALLADPARLVALLKKEMHELIKRFGDARRSVIDEAGIPTTPAAAAAAASSFPQSQSQNQNGKAGEAGEGLGGGVEAGGGVGVGVGVGGGKYSANGAGAAAVPQMMEQRAVVVTLAQGGLIKAISTEAYTKGGGSANGKAPTGALALAPTLAKGDEQLAFAPLFTTTLQYLLFFTDRGRVYGMSVKGVPEGTRLSKGESLRKFLQMAPGEQVVSMCATADFAANSYVVVFTRSGKVKKAPLSEYRAVDEKGAADFKLAGADTVLKALIVAEARAAGGPVAHAAAAGAGSPADAITSTSANSGGGFGEYFITTDQGQTLRFSDEEVRAQQGRQGQGVQAMNVPPGARVVGADYLLAGEEGRFLLAVLTAKGYGKKTALTEYPAKGRATGGVVTIELTKGDKVAQALLVAAGAGAGAGASSSGSLPVVMVSQTNKGQASGLAITAIPATKRANRGAQLVKLESDGEVVQTAFVLF
jgi:DNA gyrase subunit A